MHFESKPRKVTLIFQAEGSTSEFTACRSYLVSQSRSIKFEGDLAVAVEQANR